MNGDSCCGPRVSVVRTASALDGERPHATVSDRARRYLRPDTVTRRAQLLWPRWRWTPRAGGGV